MKEPDFLYEIADFPLEKPVIITHSEFEWDDEKKDVVRVDKEHIYYDVKEKGVTQ
jgi:hypothetical protein